MTGEILLNIYNTQNDDSTFPAQSGFFPGFAAVVAWDQGQDPVVAIFLSDATTRTARYALALVCAKVEGLSNQTETSVDPVTAAPSPVCLDSHCYRLVPHLASLYDAVTLAAADSYLGMRGHLVTVTSAAENSFLLSYVRNVSATIGVWIAASNLFGSSQDLVQWVAGPEYQVDLLVKV